ncbi:Copia protein, partial [Mucuna pruriens]
MMNEFEMSDLGLLSYLLGIEFEMNQYGMQSNPTGTPTEVGFSLKKETNEEQANPTYYRRIVGCLRFMQEPRKSHLLATKRILRYVQGTIDFGILFPKGEAVVEPELEKNSKKVKLLVDNKSVTDLARHPTSHGRSKHIKTRFHFLREQVDNIFTKALKRERFKCLRDSFGIICVNATLNK